MFFLTMKCVGFGFLLVIKEQLSYSSGSESANASHVLGYAELRGESAERLFLLQQADAVLCSLAGWSQDAGQSSSACELLLF